MIRFSLISGVLLSSAFLASANPAPEPPPTVTPISPTSFHLDWDGTLGNTYFVQSSSDLLSWQYMPIIKSGTGIPLGYGFNSSGGKLFLRLHFTDIPTTDPLTADFDGDGISNWDEVKENGTNTSPFLADTNNDGIRDDGLVFAALSDPDGAGMLTSLGNGLIGRWDFESASGFPISFPSTPASIGSATSVSNVTWSQNTGMPSHAAILGNSSYLNLPPQILDNVSNVTYSIWVKFAENSLTGTNGMMKTIVSVGPNSNLPPLFHWYLGDNKKIYLATYWIQQETIYETMFSVGDPSDSHSERWQMTITGTNPEIDKRKFNLVSEEFGVVVQKPFKLRQGASYEITVTHVATNKANGKPDYDWEAKVGDKPAGLGTVEANKIFVVESTNATGKTTWIVDNQDSLLTSERQENDNNLTVSKTARLLPVDLDIIKPGTEDDTNPTEISEEKEDYESEKKEGGWVVSLNWDDDDNDGGEGGHGKVTFKNDFDDENGTQGEDDLVQLKVHRIAVDNVKGRLKFDAVHFRVWKKKDRTEEVKSEDTEFDVKKDEDLILYIEGKKITEAEAPKNVELQIKVGNQADFQKAEEVSLHVATPIIYAAGVWGRGSAREAIDIHSKIKPLRIDERKGSLVVKGKDTEGKQIFYSVDIFHVDKGSDGGTANTTIRGVNLDKELKMAMGVLGACVIYSGHANYGLGPNFTPENVGATTVDDYMNVSSHGLAAINLRAVPKDSNPDNPDPEDIENTFKDIEHGGPNFSLRENDVPENAENELVPLTGTKRWPSFPNAMAKKLVGTHPYHHESVGNTHVNWYTVVKSTGDKPTLKYESCFMNACSSGRHFGMDLRVQGKVFFYSTNSCVAASYGDDGDIYASTFYIQSLIKGDDFGEIKDALNVFENALGGNQNVWNFKN